MGCRRVRRLDKRDWSPLVVFLAADDWTGIDESAERSRRRRAVGERDSTHMNGNELLRIVDAIHRDKNIDKEIVIEGIEQAIISAARKHFGEEHEVEAHLDRLTG